IEPDQIYTLTSDNGANMLKAVSLIEKDISELQELDNELAETCIENNFDLDEDRIIELLIESTEENTYCLDNDYEQTENILNEIQSFQNIGGNILIFTGVRCVAHTLQLAVLDSLKDNGIEKLLNKVRSLIKKLRNQTYIYIYKKRKIKVSHT
ncbi:uncharacterized protein LOC132923826, partial [Rhopalosiphum padi]|uniref:uncharacterized protein LOC132923826 n=1 Tax=Rhopalosiphum padi TaxID=40932 RepID=UPI00298D9C59